MTSHPEPNQKVAPTPLSERITSLDLARGFALIGIFICNLPMMVRHPREGYNAYLMTDIPGMYEFLYMLEFLSGTQRGMFSLLFGAGIVLFMDSLQKKGVGFEAGDIFFRRIAWLFVFGLVNVYVFLWPGDILVSYALVVFLAFACRNLMPSKMFWLAGALVVFTVLFRLPGYLDVQNEQLAFTAAEQVRETGAELTKEQEEAISTWEKKLDMSEQIKAGDKSRELVSEGILGIWKNVHMVNGGTLTYFLYGTAFIGSFIMFLIGMGLYKIGLFNPTYSLRKIGILALIGLSVGGTYRFFTIQHYMSGVDPIANSMVSVFYHVDRIFLTVGFIAFAILLARIGAGPIRRSVAAMGQLALTNYLTQSIISSSIIYGAGMYGYATGYDLFTILAVVIVLQLIWSPIILKYYRFGPFEWLWRCLTYGTKLPFKR